MSEYPGLRSVTGATARPIHSDCPGPGRCGCREDLGQSCPSCDGASKDGSVVVLAMADYRRQHPTNPQGDAA